MTFEDYELSLNLDLEQIDDRYILDVARNAWNAAINAALEKLLHSDYYYDNGNKWNDDCYSSTDPKADIKKLLTS